MTIAEICLVQTLLAFVGVVNPFYSAEYGLRDFPQSHTISVFLPFLCTRIHMCVHANTHTYAHPNRPLTKRSYPSTTSVSTGALSSPQPKCPLLFISMHLSSVLGKYLSVLGWEQFCLVHLQQQISLINLCYPQKPSWQYFVVLSITWITQSIIILVMKRKQHFSLPAHAKAERVHIFILLHTILNIHLASLFCSDSSCCLVQQHWCCK